MGKKRKGMRCSEGWEGQEGRGGWGERGRELSVLRDGKVGRE